jgi:brefeldin A-inhibited guanine nucleotide-exchange protein
MHPSDVMVIAACLERSYRFAREFNRNIPLRQALHAAGFMQQMPNLLKQETYACSSLLVLLQRLFAESDPAYDGIRADVRARLFLCVAGGRRRCRPGF